MLPAAVQFHEAVNRQTARLPLYRLISSLTSTVRAQAMDMCGGMSGDGALARLLDGLLHHARHPPKGLLPPAAADHHVHVHDLAAMLPPGGVAT